MPEKENTFEFIVLDWPGVPDYLAIMGWENPPLCPKESENLKVLDQDDLRSFHTWAVWILNGNRDRLLYFCDNGQIMCAFKVTVVCGLQSCSPAKHYLCSRAAVSLA